MVLGMPTNAVLRMSFNPLLIFYAILGIGIIASARYGWMMQAMSWYHNMHHPDFTKPNKTTVASLAPTTIAPGAVHAASRRLYDTCRSTAAHTYCCDHECSDQEIMFYNHAVAVGGATATGAAAVGSGASAFAYCAGPAAEAPPIALALGGVCAVGASLSTAAAGGAVTAKVASHCMWQESSSIPCSVRHDLICTPNCD